MGRPVSLFQGHRVDPAGVSVMELGPRTWRGCCMQGWDGPPPPPRSHSQPGRFLCIYLPNPRPE